MSEYTIRGVRGVQYATVYQRIRSAVPFVWIGEAIFEALNRKVILLSGILQNWTTSFLSKRILTILVFINPQLSAEQRKKLLIILSRMVDKIILEKNINPREMKGVIALACPNRDTSLLFAYLLDTISGIADSICSEMGLSSCQASEIEPDVEVGDMSEPSTSSSNYNDVCHCECQFHVQRISLGEHSGVRYSDDCSQGIPRGNPQNDPQNYVCSSNSQFRDGNVIVSLGSQQSSDLLSNSFQESTNRHVSNFISKKTRQLNGCATKVELQSETKLCTVKISVQNHKLMQQFVYKKNIPPSLALLHDPTLVRISREYVEEMIIWHSLSYFCCVESIYVAAMPSVIRKTVLEALWGKDIVRKQIISNGNYVSTQTYKRILNSISLPNCCISLDVLVLQDGTVSNDVVAIVQKMHGFKNKSHAHLFKGYGLYDWLSSTPTPNNPKTRSQVLPTDIYRLSS